MKRSTWDTNLIQKLIIQCRKKLPQFIKAVITDSIFDSFEVKDFNGEEPECDEELSYLSKVWKTIFK